jgi:flagellar motility protein MotE (MotC chaperone)
MATISDAFAGRRLPTRTTLNALLEAMDSPSETRAEIRALWLEAHDQMNGSEIRGTHRQEHDDELMDPSAAARKFSEMFETYRWKGIIRRLKTMNPGRAADTLDHMSQQSVVKLLAEMDPTQAVPLLLATPERAAAWLTEMPPSQAAERLLSIPTPWQTEEVMVWMEPKKAAGIVVEAKDWIAATLKSASKYNHEWIDKVLAEIDPKLTASLRKEMARW